MGEKEYHLEGFEKRMIPFEFHPLEFREYECVIEIQKDELSWKFPIRGLPEVLMQDTVDIVSKARTKVERDIILTIPSGTFH